MTYLMSLNTLMKRDIYIIGDESGKIKLGIGKNPSRRVKQLQTGNSEKLTILYQRSIMFTTKVESTIHRHYAEYRGQGEWFDIPNFSYSKFDDLVSLYESNFIVLSQQENPFL